LLRLRQPPRPTLFPYTTLFRSVRGRGGLPEAVRCSIFPATRATYDESEHEPRDRPAHSSTLQSEHDGAVTLHAGRSRGSCSLSRSEEHTSELQSRFDLVCRLLL